MFAKISPRLIADYFSESERLSAIVSCNGRRYGRNLWNGVEVVESFPFANCHAITMEKKKLFALSKTVGVNFISSIQDVSSQMELSKKVMQLHNYSHDTYSGEGQTIAIIDTGIYPHVDFTLGENRIIHFQDMVNGKLSPYDDNGHGTMVAGVSSGGGCNSHFKYSGVAPRAKIISVKSMSEDGAGSSMDILRGMQWVYDNRRKYNINVVCMSLGAESLGDIDPLMQGAEVLSKCGICVVTASGNSGGTGTVKSPGIAPSVITTGCFDDCRTVEKEDDVVAEFSSCGPTEFGSKPDLIATGVNICSTARYDKSGKFYDVFTGTSVSSALVSGVCLLMSEKLGVCDTTTIKKELLKHCEKHLMDKNIEGEGFLYF